MLLSRPGAPIKEAQRDFHGEYTAFLRDCNLQLTVRSIQLDKVISGAFALNASSTY